MNINIRGKETELKFGIKFALEMDKMHVFDNGVGEVSMGLLYHMENIKLRGSKASLILVLLTAARTTLNDETITEDDIYNAIDEQEDYSLFFEQSKEYLWNLSVVQSSLKEMQLMTQRVIEMNQAVEKEQQKK